MTVTRRTNRKRVVKEKMKEVGEERVKLEVEDIKPFFHYSLLSTATLDLTDSFGTLSRIGKLIISHASRDTLATLLRCCKLLFREAGPQLYEHVRTTQARFASMIAANTMPVQPFNWMSLLEPSPEPLSPYLQKGLARIRTLHFTEFRTKWIMPDVLRGKSKPLNITSVVLRRRRDDEEHHPLYIPAALLARLVSSQIRNITLLLQSTRQLDVVTAECCRQLEGYVRAGRVVTIVLLPYFPIGEDGGWATISPFWQGFSERMKGSSELSCIRMVGTEYAGYKHVPGNAWDCQSEYMDSDDENEEETEKEVFYGPEYMTFLTWLALQGAGTMFSPEEEASLRAIDKELVIERSPSCPTRGSGTTRGGGDHYQNAEKRASKAGPQKEKPVKAKKKVTESKAKKAEGRAKGKV